MNGARIKLLITLGKIIFLSIGRAMEQNQILQVMSSKGKAYRVRVAPPHGWSGTPLKQECVWCNILTYKWDRSWANRLSTNPHPAHRAMAEKRGKEGEEMDVARTPRKLVSDGTRVGGVCRTARHEC